MTALPFGLSAYSRANGRLPRVRLINLYAERTPTTSGGQVLFPRPGLQLEYDLGAEVRGLYRSDGVFAGDVFAVAGEALYRNEDIVGEVLGEDRVEWAYTVDGLFLVSGGVVYQSEDGVTVAPTAFPDDAAVSSIASINNILVAVRADLGTVYFRLPGDTTWNPLDFFSAEREPDPAVCVRTLSDALYVFGTATVEPFAPTGDAAVPFSRIDGLSINRGLKDRDSAVKMDNTIIFTGENDIVYRIEGSPRRISDHGIEEQIVNSSSASCWWHPLYGHDFYVMKLDEETVCYDAATGEWHSLDWPVAFGLFDGQVTYVASGSGVHTLRDRPDDNGVVFQRLFTAVMPVEQVVACDAIEVQLSPGTVAPNAEPAIIQMRWSDDQGRSFTSWKEATTGFSGQYRHRTRYRRLGVVDPPGRVFEIRCTDPVEIRFSGVELNPYIGGRSRGLAV